MLANRLKVLMWQIIRLCSRSWLNNLKIWGIKKPYQVFTQYGFRVVTFLCQFPLQVGLIYLVDKLIQKISNYLYFFITNVAFVPPKPKLLDIIRSNSTSRFSVTISKPCAFSSKLSTLIDGATKLCSIIRIE